MRIGMFADAHYAGGLTLGSRYCVLSLEKMKKVLIALADCDELFNLGDLVNATGDPDADERNVAEALSLLESRGAHSVLGNHDAEVARKTRFLPEPWYSLTRDGVTLIVLDANFTPEGASYDEAEWSWERAIIPEQEHAWLARELARAPGEALVFVHENIDYRENGEGIKDPHVTMNSAVTREILEKSGKVKAVFQGHCHGGFYQEINGIPYYTLPALCEGNRIPCAVAEYEGGRLDYSLSYIE